MLSHRVDTRRGYCRENLLFQHGAPNLQLASSVLAVGTAPLSPAQLFAGVSPTQNVTGLAGREARRACLRLWDRGNRSLRGWGVMEEHTGELSDPGWARAPGTVLARYKLRHCCVVALVLWLRHFHVLRSACPSIGAPLGCYDVPAAQSGEEHTWEKTSCTATELPEQVYFVP